MHPHSVEEKRWDMGPTIETNGRDHWTTVPAGGSTPVSMYLASKFV